MRLEACRCGCRQREDLFCTASDIDFEIEVIDLVLRSMGDASVEDGTEPGTDLFLPEELAVAALLASAFKDRGMAVRHYLVEAISGFASSQRILAALDTMNGSMRETFSDVSERVGEELGRTLNRGAWQVPNGFVAGQNGPSVDPGYGTVLQNLRQVEILHAGIVNAARYSTNTFFNNQIIPAIERQMANLIQGVSSPDFSPILETLDARLRSVPYWRLIASAAASRGFHYGYTKAAEVLGYTDYQFVAVVDDKTSDVCLAMNGKRFKISAAVDIMERVAEAENPDDFKNITPWLGAEQIKSLSDSELIASGVLIPPLHPFCRSTIELVR